MFLYNNQTGVLARLGCDNANALTITVDWQFAQIELAKKCICSCYIDIIWYIQYNSVEDPKHRSQCSGQMAFNTP